MTEDIAITITKEDLRMRFQKFMYKEFSDVVNGEMNDDKNEFYTRCGVGYCFIDELFEQPVKEGK